MELQNANSLKTKSDWKNLQQALIALHQSPDKAYTLKTDATAKIFLENYVADNGKDGIGAAQSILKYATGQNYFIPHLLPYVENGINKSINNPLMEILNAEFSVYPNPASQQLNFIYNGNKSEVVYVTLSNMLGKIVYTSEAGPKNELQIDLADIPTGAYVLAAYKGRERVYQTKVICVK